MSKYNNARVDHVGVNRRTTQNGLAPASLSATEGNVGLIVIFVKHVFLGAVWSLPRKNSIREDGVPGARTPGLISTQL
jgi:hypothetical protein